MDTHHVRAGQNYDDGQSPRRLAAVLLVAGIVMSFAAGALHPEGANANDHAAAFAECWAAAAALALYGALQAVDGVALKHWRGFPRPLAGIALILVWTLWLLASSLWRS